MPLFDELVDVLKNAHLLILWMRCPDGWREGVN